ncbi:MAG: hypothetical protein LBP33_02815, partial [Candidatus Adiutrix sp.]|nr:hypothetical protein [Candidatus Adiutrix sp.]
MRIIPFHAFSLDETKSFIVVVQPAANAVQGFTALGEGFNNGVHPGPFFTGVVDYSHYIHFIRKSKASAVVGDVMLPALHIFGAVGRQEFRAFAFFAQGDEGTGVRFLELRPGPAG